MRRVRVTIVAVENQYLLYYECVCARACVCVCVCVCVCIVALYRVSQELRSLRRDLIPELILSQKCHIHMGPIRSG
jgi:hypothetical protein